MPANIDGKQSLTFKNIPKNVNICKSCSQTLLCLPLFSIFKKQFMQNTKKKSWVNYRTFYHSHPGKFADFCEMHINIVKCECVEINKHTCRRSSLDEGPLSHSRSLLHKRWHAVHQSLSFPCYRYETSGHHRSLKSTPNTEHP